MQRMIKSPWAQMSSFAFALQFHAIGDRHRKHGHRAYQRSFDRMDYAMRGVI